MFVWCKAWGESAWPRPPSPTAPFALRPLAAMIRTSARIFINPWMIAEPSMAGIIMSVSTTAIVSRWLAYIASASAPSEAPIAR